MTPRAVPPARRARRFTLEQGCVPGGTLRNFDSYGARLARCLMHTSTCCATRKPAVALLVAVSPQGEDEFLAVARELGLQLHSIGELVAQRPLAVEFC